MNKNQRTVTGIHVGPAYLWGLVVRIVLLDDGAYKTQQWDDSDGWIDSELT